MTNKERRLKYEEYLKELSNDPRSTKCIELLNEAFNVHESDILADVDNIVNASSDTPVSVLSYMIGILMDDLRDYRDINSIRKTRQQILLDARNTEELNKNKKYLFRP